MKFTKYFFGLLAAVAMLAIAPRAEAQKAGVNNLLSGAVLPTLTTNQFVTAGVTNQAGSPTGYTITSSNLVQSVGEYDYAGITWQYTWPVGSTNGITNLKVYESFDNGQTFGANPVFTYAPTPAAAGAPGTWTTNQVVDIHGVTHLAFSLDNNATGFISNVVLRVNLKAPRVTTTPAKN